MSGLLKICKGRRLLGWFFVHKCHNRYFYEWKDSDFKYLLFRFKFIFMYVSRYFCNIQGGSSLLWIWPDKNVNIFLNLIITRNEKWELDIKNNIKMNEKKISSARTTIKNYFICWDDHHQVWKNNFLDIVVLKKI